MSSSCGLTSVKRCGERAPAVGNVVQSPGIQRQGELAAPPREGRDVRRFELRLIETEHPGHDASPLDIGLGEVDSNESSARTLAERAESVIAVCA